MKDERQIGYAKMQRLTLRIWTGYIQGNIKPRNRCIRQYGFSMMPGTTFISYKD